MEAFKLTTEETSTAYVVEPDNLADRNMFLAMALAILPMDKESLDARRTENDKYLSGIKKGCAPMLSVVDKGGRLTHLATRTLIKDKKAADKELAVDSLMYILGVDPSAVEISKQLHRRLNDCKTATKKRCLKDLKDFGEDSPEYLASALECVFQPRVNGRYIIGSLQGLYNSFGNQPDVWLDIANQIRRDIGSRKKTLDIVEVALKSLSITLPAEPQK